MEFRDFKTNNIYFSVSNGQYIGTFYIVQRNDKVLKILISYFGGGVRLEIIEEEDLEEYQTKWLQNSFHISKKPNDRRIKEDLREMIGAIFEQTNISKNLARSYQ